MKITLLGAGSHFFENVLFEISQNEDLHGAEIALYDPDLVRLDLIHRVGQRIANHLGSGLKFLVARDLPEALDGADAVISSIGVHGPGQAWHLLDVEAVGRHGVMQTTGDTVGPSGISQGLRIVPIYIEVAQAMERYCPGTHLLNHSNPMGAICRAVGKYTKTPVIGYCHNVVNGLRTFGALLECDPEELDFSVAGVNHMVWLLSLRRRGEDVYPELKRKFLEAEPAKDRAFTKELLETFDLYMLGGDRHIIEFFPHARRADAPEKIDYGLLWRSEMIKQKLLAEELTKHAADLARRASGEAPLIIPQHVSPEAMGRQIRALKMGPDIVHVSNTPNCGAIPNVPDWAVVEVKSIVGQHGCRPVFVGELPPAAARFTLAQIYAHEVMIEAAAEQSRTKAIQALACDPMVRDLKEATVLLDAMVEVQGDRLAGFRGSSR